MVNCSLGDHDDCKHVLVDAFQDTPDTTLVRWGQDHVTYPVEGDWTPSKEAMAKWVDVRFVDLDAVPWNWHLTIENAVDRAFYRTLDDEEATEPDEPNWAVLDVDYNCWIDVVYYDNYMEELVAFARPLDTDKADYADRLAELVDEALEAQGEELNVDKVKIATIGGWTSGHLSNALSAWLHQETGRSFNVVYDDDADPSPMHARATEQLEAIRSGDEETYEIGVLDNGMKVAVPAAVFEQLASMEPSAVKAMMEAMNDGPGSIPRDSDPE